METYVLLKTIYQGYNFGSSLQAYALKKYIQNTFCVDCKIIEREEIGNRAKLFRIKKKIINVGKSLLSPRLFVESWTSHFTKNENKLSFSQKTIDAFQTFIETEIAPVRLPLKELKRLARNKDCLICITGSDQVWNPSGTHLNEENFLRFSPRGKTLSYAASIGVTRIPYYNELSFKNGVSHIRFLSVREETAKELLREKYGLQAQVCVDPVLLVGRQFWETCKEQHCESSPFILAFFLNKPSHAALEMIKHYSAKDIRVKVLSRECFYDYGVSVEMVEELSPFQFLALLQDAECVLTDSFHGMVFSLIFEREFYAFARDYGKYISQSSRIVSLLRRLGIESRYIENDTIEHVKSIKLDYSCITPILEEERIKSARFLADSFKTIRDGQERF